MTSLDFYAKIESIIGLNEACDRLYEIFLDEISSLKFSGFKALDFGCGNGNFALKLAKQFSVIGIDKSVDMVAQACKKGVDARCVSLDEINEKFDLITASFDVLNYMDKAELKEFLSKIPNILNDNGYFIFDINTKFGFSDIANGLLYESDENQNHLIIDAKFDGNCLETQMILFEKSGDKFAKFQNRIIQFYHKKDEIKKLLNLKLYRVKELNLYSDTKADKLLFVFKKVAK
ncbi:class I SAM-dependent DNA methyltransferase [Campylobacter geochelonis]|uniref:class I SAM-dependent DNA methyltransferase n=1 Tax=Campylobacter geochelonis TaxID=1780362 RepID=UPI0007709F34|nr:class I SAM-dependent methyltransferase [Campylobacter geochelonis]CZE48878.1 Mg-protoporphyrin IX methyl transferase [Campylobacter geochelonis]CZE51374.1 Mg-protoporphyrin IX methyl transferase [Campylobacter geochelonis]